MHSKGLSRKAVLVELSRIHNLDKRYDDGRILCSMCTEPHPIAKKAYQLFLSSNLGDPGLFPGSVQLEKDVINNLAALLHGEGCVGFVVSGGTEANLMALLAARNMSNVSQPEVVLPESSHFSLAKICGLLNLKPIYAGLDNCFRVDPSSVKECISENTIAIVGTAGTAELGVVDPIDSLAHIADKRNIWLHVDAAFGGLIIPFLSNSKINFDFSLNAVKSMTVDPHKMGLAAIPAGGIIFRDSKPLDYLKTETPYLTDRFQYTFAGTRPGASAASVWAVFEYLGIEGYKKVVDDCMRTTQLLTDGLNNAGFELLVKPMLNIIAFRSSAPNKNLAQKLWQRGRYISYIPRYDCLRIIVMPHIKKRHALAFLQDLIEIAKL